MIVHCELENTIEHKSGSCWLCNDEKRVEWSGLSEEDENGAYEVIEGVYDPCPECENREVNGGKSIG